MNVRNTFHGQYLRRFFLLRLALLSTTPAHLARLCDDCLLRGIQLLGSCWYSCLILSLARPGCLSSIETIKYCYVYFWGFIIVAGRHDLVLIMLE